MAYLQQNQERLGRFRAGDREVLGDVFDHYAPRLFAALRPGVCYYCQGQAHFLPQDRIPIELEDVVQQTFLQAFEERARLRYSGLVPFLSYLTSIARNIMLSSLRDRSIPVKDDELEEALSLGQASTEVPGTPDKLYDNRELSALVSAFAGSLNRKNRTIFLERFLEKKPRARLESLLHLTPMQLRHREKHLLVRFLRYLRRSGHGR